MSDVDVAIYLRNKSEFSFDDLLMFHGECCRVLASNDVDILVLNTTRNLILLDEIIRYGKIIYNKKSTTS